MRFRRSHAVVLMAGLAIAACESTAAPPVAPPPATASAPPPGPATACLMTHICGCNLGCARVAVAPPSLREGMHTTAQTGPYAGKDLIVMKEADATGASVFTLSDREHASACELETAQRKSLLGFACASKDSGPIPAHACSTCD